MRAFPSAILTASVILLTSSGCHFHHSSYAFWPFRSNTAGDAFADAAAHPESADPFMNSASPQQLVQDANAVGGSPQQTAENFSGGPQPTTGIVNATHEQGQSFAGSSTMVVPAGGIAATGPWQSRTP